MPVGPIRVCVSILITEEHLHAFDTHQPTMSVAEYAGYAVLNPHGEKYQSGLSFPPVIS